MQAPSKPLPCAVDERQMELPFVPALPPCKPTTEALSWPENPLNLPPLSEETKKLLKKFDWD